MLWRNDLVKEIRKMFKRDNADIKCRLYSTNSIEILIYGNPTKREEVIKVMNELKEKYSEIRSDGNGWVYNNNGKLGFIYYA